MPPDPIVGWCANGASIGNPSEAAKPTGGSRAGRSAPQRMSAVRPGRNIDRQLDVGLFDLFDRQGADLVEHGVEGNFEGSGLSLDLRE